MGVFHPDLVGIHIRVLKNLGAKHALVVWGKDGMDEISLGAGTLVGELKDGRISEYEIHPEDFGLSMASSRNLVVANADESRATLLGVLDDTPGPARDICLLNAGAALYTAGVAADIADGAVLADSLEELFAVPDASADQGVVEVMTIHKSKGLEWDTVFILDPQLMPSKWAKLPWQQQQEKNLQYVAVTRAKLHLKYITSNSWN